MEVSKETEALSSRNSCPSLATIVVYKELHVVWKFNQWNNFQLDESEIDGISKIRITRWYSFLSIGALSRL